MMRIDSLAVSADRSGRYLVKFGDGSVLRLYRQTVEDFGLYPGCELDEDRMEQLRKHASATSAKMRAVRIVSAAGVSRRDLEQRLVHKGEDPEMARQAVEWMEGLNLLDDSKTASQIVARCAAKGYGISRAKQALYEKQIPKSLWEDALADYPDQTEYILGFLREKLVPGDLRQRKKVIDALMRRGHSYGQINRALSLMGDESEEYLEDI